MQNYANDVVANLLDACLLKSVPPPTIVSESGRALASHSGVLVFNVLPLSPPPCPLLPLSLAEATAELAQDVPGQQQPNPSRHLLRTFYDVYASMDSSNFREASNDAQQFQAEASSLFKLGCLSLPQRALGDRLHQV